jgi:tetratricopeptide (TPR) repeat protein
MKNYGKLTLLMASLALFTGISNASNSIDFFTQGCVASMSRQWESSIESFTRAIESNPENAAAYVQRATSYQMVDRLDDAIRDYESALRLKPDYYLAMEYLANLYEITNEPSKAVETYSKALPLVKDPKWRSIITWKISEARKKIPPQRVGGDRSVSGMNR